MLHPGNFHPTADIRRHWAVYLGLVIALAIWCGVDVTRRARVDPRHPALHMTDFTVYTEAGAAFFDGREPYDVSNIRGWKYLYPPLFALLVAPLAALPPHWQAGVWFALSAWMMFGCYFECRRLASALSDAGWFREPERTTSAPMIPNGIERAADSRTFPLWLFVTALLAALFPVLNCLQRGQMGLSLVYPLLLGFRLIWLGKTRTAWLVGGLVLALPIALKLTPALPACGALATLIVAAFHRGMTRSNARDTLLPTPHSELRTPHLSPIWGTSGLLAGTLLFFLLLPAALIGWNDNLRHLETWYVRVASRVNDVRDDDFSGDAASVRNQSLFNAVYRGGNWVAYKFFDGPDDLRIDVTQATMPMDAPIVSHILSVVRFAALAALGAVIVAAGRGGHPLLHGVAFGLAGVATLVVSPVSRGHYFVFWLPAVVFVPLWFRQIGRQRTAFALAVVPAALSLAHYALLPYAGRIGLLGLGTTAWFFTTCLGIWTCRAEAVASAPIGAVEVDPAKRLTQAA
jgi:hypothetical protein